MNCCYFHKRRKIGDLCKYICGTVQKFINMKSLQIGNMVNLRHLSWTSKVKLSICVSSKNKEVFFDYQKKYFQDKNDRDKFINLRKQK